MKGIKKEIHINDKVIYYTHIEKGSSTVCFMFSGSGYNYNKPNVAGTNIIAVCI